MGGGGGHHHGGGGWGGSNWGGWAGGPTIWSPTIVEPIFLPYPMPTTIPSTDEIGLLPSPIPSQYPLYVGDGLDGLGKIEGLSDLAVLGVLGALVGSVMATHRYWAAGGGAIGLVAGVAVGYVLRKAQ